MGEYFTRCMDEIEDNKDDNCWERDIRPKKQTLEFLRQFARVYKVEKNLVSEQEGYVIN